MCRSWEKLCRRRCIRSLRSSTHIAHSLPSELSGEPIHVRQELIDVRLTAAGTRKEQQDDASHGCSPYNPQSHLIGDFYQT